MKRFLLTIIALTSLSANANQSYSYLSGGYQFTRVSENGMGEYFEDQYNNEESKYLHGAYFRGSWNFYDHLFAEYRIGATTRTSSSLTQNYLALGYYIPLTSDSSLYASAGYADYNAKRSIDSGCGLFDFNDECQTIRFSGYDKGYSAEFGARFQLFPWLQIEPSYRYADFSDEGQHEFRLTNLLTLSENSSFEVNGVYRHWNNLNETNFQLGYRYSF
ncbi:outer membrane beta-barrel protein [Psychromonas aquimarina]|uniref:outer membrane beta-barrel protein n=1 Tax=Psychromonas aquimarina TaxID=444919 RepID=UPI001B7FD526|nr:outer membrane beta-barrel protein [Psychromonas aquimarina]